MDTSNLYVYDDGTRRGPYQLGQISSMWHQGLLTSKATYYGIKVTERALVPEDDASLGKMRFDEWLGKSA